MLRSNNKSRKLIRSENMSIEIRYYQSSVYVQTNIFYSNIATAYTEQAVQLKYPKV